MKHLLASLPFLLHTHALVPRNQPQCIQLHASGPASGTLGQLSDGQNRIGGNNPTGCYCLSNGGFTDSQGRGCILTPPTTQFQCDVGASPMTGFTLGKDGSVMYNGSTKFYACPVNDNGEWNVYSMPAPGQDKCVEIMLSSGGACGSNSSPPPSECSQAPPPPPPQTTPTKPMPAKQCPADLNGSYQFPHLIVPVDSQHPTTAYGTSYNGKVSSTICSIFNFDIPASYAGSTCSLIFLFPQQKDLTTSSYMVSGSGMCHVSKLAMPATQGTTWNNVPAKTGELGSWMWAPGNSYSLASGDCEAGKTVAYEVCSDGSYALEYFQDYNPSPIGLYVRQC